MGSSGDGSNGSQELATEFWSVVGVQDVRATAAKVEFVEEARYEAGGLAIRKWNHKDSFGETVDESQGLGLASDGEALALEIHGIAGAGLGGGVRRKETMG